MPQSGQIRIKRVYEEPAKNDGRRILVDRLWPRGLSKENCKLDAWLKDLAPSQGLRKSLHESPESWPAFRKRYLKELRLPVAAGALGQLYRLASSRKPITLLFASKDAQHNNAIVLQELLQGLRKPPTGTGPLRAGRERQTKRLRG